MSIVDSIVEFAVSEQVGESAWGKLVTSVVEVYNSEGISVESTAEVLKNAEKEFKSQYGKSVPAAYRSAKSVALKALRLKVALLDDNGQPLGKTAVQNACKAVEEKSEPDDVDKLHKACATINNIYMSTCVPDVADDVLKRYDLYRSV